MRQYAIVIFVFTFAVFSAKAQFTLTGQLKDTAKETVSAATVMLLNIKDTTLVNFTTSDAKGQFAFKNIKKANYFLKISHVTYMPQEIYIEAGEEKEMDLGIITMKPIAHFLMEVVIREAKAPIFIRGDTVEYDATTFKVPPGSTIEDLLRRLPGIDVDANGNISTMGKDVKTVYVDGKAFFGNDPKTVTQNLDAAAVSKVQVFTEKSEQEKLTGIKDGSQEKVMNVELKNEYKKGYFGKASLGYGWGENALHRWTARGNFNWFTDKQQLSFIGYGNNINQSSFDWGDMSEFKGQSMRMGADGDFGFGSSGYGRRMNYSYYGNSSSGFSQNGGGGVNYNYFKKKIKFNLGYFYTANRTFNEEFANRKTFLQDSTFWQIDTAQNENVRQNHSLSTGFEYNIDSNNTIYASANFDYSLTSRENAFNKLYQNAEFININLHTVDNKYQNDKIGFRTKMVYNHKFKKKGRSFAVSGYYNLDNGTNLENIDNINEYFRLTTQSEWIKFRVKNNKDNKENTVKSSVLYVEPIGKRVSIMGFYNFRNTVTTNKNTSSDTENDNADIDSLWLNYKNTTLYNRIGSMANYNHNGINLSLGAAFQSLKLNGEIDTKPQSVEKLDIPAYNNFIPHLSIDIELPRNFDVDIYYSYEVSEPDMAYLFPMPNLSNMMNKTLGNPNLKPERYHRTNINFSYYNSAAMTNFSFSLHPYFYQNQIVYNQYTEYIENQGYVTVASPENIDGGNAFSAHFWTHFPIVKTKLTMSMSGSGSLSNSPVFINRIENNTHSTGYNGSMSFSLTLGQKLSFYLSGNVSQTFTKYSIQSDRNQSYMNYGSSVSGKWQVFKKTFLESSFNFSNYTNKTFDFNKNIYNLHVSVRQVIGKKNQWELRLAAVDILNQNKYINQIAALNYIENRTSPTLAQYFLLTVAYNIKGFEAKNNSRRAYYY